MTRKQAKEKIDEKLKDKLTPNTPPQEVVKDNFNFIGNVIESKPNTVFDENFGIQVSYFENNAHFKQKIEVLDESLLQIKIAYMVCNEQMCIPFEKTYELNLEI